MSEKSQNKTRQDQNPPDQKGKKRDRGASEGRLMAAGVEVFSKYGYNGATTKMIATTADVNESLIGRYFDGKEGLLLSIVERFISKLHEEALPYEPQNNIEDELVQYITHKIHVSKSRTNFGKIIISQALTNERFRKKALERIPMFKDPNLIARLKKLKVDGKLAPTTNIEDICQDVDNYLHGIFMFSMILKGEPEKVTLKEAIRFIRHYARNL